MTPSPQALRAVADVLRSGWLSAGPQVVACERSLADLSGRAEAVLTGSPASALHLALTCAGAAAGNEVVVSALSSAAVAVAVRDAGAQRVCADVDSPRSPVMSSTGVASQIGPHTAGVVASYLAGNACELEPLIEICEARGLPLIEDLSEGALALDAVGSRAGTRGIAAVLSFGPEGPVPTLPAGALLCDDPVFAERARRLRSHGMTSPTWSRHTGTTTTYDVEELGFSYRPDEARAALIDATLVDWSLALEHRRMLTHAYRERLSRLPGVSVPYSDSDVTRDACSRMVVLLAGRLGTHEARDRLARSGVSATTLVVEPSGVPVATDVAGRALVLPLSPSMDERDVDMVVAALSQATSV